MTLTNMNPNNQKVDLKKWAKDFGNSLIGNPDFRRNEPDVAIIPIDIIVRDLVQIPEDHWWKYAFMREPMNSKFTDTERRRLMEQAIGCGREYADQCVEKYGTNDPNYIAKELGLNVDYPEQPQNGHRVLFAEYRDPNIIHIYADGVRRGEKLLASDCVKNELHDIDLNRILLSHEIFHWLEKENGKTIWTMNFEISLWKIGKIENRTHIACLSEIAAMAFAKRLMKLEMSPYVLDAFMDYGYSPKAGTALYMEMMIDDNRVPSKASCEKDMK